MAVRRALAISLMLIFSLPLFGSLFAMQAAEAMTPACCRRDGKHHCAMSADEQDPASRKRTVSEKCPYTPAAPAVILLRSFSPSTGAAIFAGVIRHPSVAPQVAAQFRVSFDRARRKRGPPSLLA